MGAGYGNEQTLFGERLLGLVPLALAAVVYGPIVGNYFYADDFFNLFQIANESPLEFLLTPSGGHVLVARNALFYLSRQLFGTEPAYYFWTVLVTHLLNVWLVHALLRLLGASARVACFAAALWGICPLDAGALTWYSVYGHVVAAAALLGALYLLGAPAARGANPSRARFAAAFALAIVAATSFGFGTGAAAILPILLVLLFPGIGGARGRRLPPLATLFVVVPAIYFGLVRLYSSLYGTELDMAAWLHAQASAQGFSIALAFLRCAAFGLSRLVFGVFVPPAFEPMWIAYAVGGSFLLAVLAASVRASALEARRIAAWGLLALTCYGIVAVTRTQYLVEGRADFLTALARYHYLGLIALTMLLAAVLQRAAAELRPSPRLADALLAAWVATTLIVHFARPLPLDHQDQARRQTEKTLADMHTEIEKQPRGEAVYIRNRNFAALPAIAVPFQLFPGWAAAFVVFHPENTVDGRRVYFVQRNRTVIEALARGRRTRDLFVPEAPPAK